MIKPRNIAPVVPIDKDLSKNKTSKDNILTNEFPLTAKSGKKGGKKNTAKDFYTELLRYVADQKISDSDLNLWHPKVLDGLEAMMATWEKRAKISMKEHLGFGTLHTPLQTNT